MARNDVYLYTNATSPANAVITSQTTTTAATFPDLVLGDAPLFNFYFTDGTASWPSFAGNGSYTIEWAIGESVAGDDPPLALQTAATPITGGWQIRLPLNTGALITQLNSVRVGQEFPVARLWQHIRVKDSNGYPVSYALIRTNVRLRAVPDSQVAPDDPLPSGTEVVLVNAGGQLVDPTNLKSGTGSFTVESGGSLVAESGSTTNLAATTLTLPLTTTGTGTMTLRGGSSGASVAIGSGSNAAIRLTNTGTGTVEIDSGTSTTQARINVNLLKNPGEAGVPESVVSHQAYDSAGNYRQIGAIGARWVDAGATGYSSVFLHANDYNGGGSNSDVRITAGHGITIFNTDDTYPGAGVMKVYGTVDVVTAITNAGNYTGTAATPVVGVASTSSSNQSQFQASGSTNRALLFGMFGDSRSGTTFGVSNNALAYVTTGTLGSFYPTALAVGTVGSAAPVVFGVNNAEVGRFSSSAFTLKSGVSLVVATQTPASASAAGVAGTIAWDSSYVYVCTATNTWKRTALSTW